MHITEQEQGYIMQYGEEDYEKVVISGIGMVLSLFDVAEGEIQLNETVKIKVDTVQQ